MKNSRADDGGYSFETLTEDTVEEMAQLVSGDFVYDEPIYWALKLTSEEYLPLARLFVPLYASDSLSLIARDRETGQGAGFVFAMDLIHEPFGSLKEKYEATDSFWKKLMHERAFLDEMERSYIDSRKPRKGEVLLLTLLGVLRPHRGRGLATGLLRAAVDSGRRRGFAKAISECTGPASVRAHQKCGFTQAGSLDYRTYKRNGEYPFRDLSDACILMEKDLTVD